MHDATIYPLGDRLKILPLRPRELTAGGIVRPEMVRDVPLEGLVLAVGRGRLLADGTVQPLECEVGDVVSFGKYAGIHIEDAGVGHDVILMREDEALGRRKRDELGADIEGDPRCPIRAA